MMLRSRRRPKGQVGGCHAPPARVRTPDTHRRWLAPTEHYGQMDDAPPMAEEV